MSVPASEVLTRASRLVLLRDAGVPEPHRFVRTAQDTRRALRTKRVATTITTGSLPPLPPNECPWCGERIRKTRITCPDCEDLEQTLLKYRNGEV